MYFQYRKRKFGNKPQVVGGIRYDSGLEGSRAQELELLKDSKNIKSWSRQITLPLYFRDYKITSYRIDFVVYENDGSITLEETKGMETYEWRNKWKLLEAIINYDCPERKIIYDVIGAKKNTEVKLSLIK
jgi:hypothetical protein